MPVGVRATLGRVGETALCHPQKSDPMDPETKTRLATNQAALRTVNEVVRGELTGGVIGFRCECGRLGCTRSVMLSRDQYEAVRAHPRRFAVVPAHEVAEIEQVVGRHSGHAVVEVRAELAALAERTDPRGPSGE